MPPTLLFGTANIGKSYTTAPSVSSLLSTLKEAGISRLDTAARYPPTSPGTSEKLLGEAHAAAEFTIDTKILLSGDGSGCHTERAIEQSIKQSYQSLGAEKINILYCHGPDKQTPIAEQAAAFDRFYREGKFKYLGVSNFSIPMLQEWLSVAEKHGYVKPTVYQGQYNLVVRTYEEELLPFLREHGIRFYAFGPVAGGFLTGKFSPNSSAEALKGTRFEVSDNNPFGRAARHWYDKPGMHEVNDRLRKLARESGIAMEALAMRWLVYHSALREEDGVIFGASTPEMARGTAEVLKGGPLSEEVVRGLEGLWEVCREEARGVVQY